MAHQTYKNTNIDESGIVHRAKAGDKAALSEIIRKYEKKIYNYALHFVHNREDAEDILQETFLSVVKAIDSFKGQSRLSTWIYKIATNAALMKLRSPGSAKREFESFDEDNIDLSRNYIEINRRLSESPFEMVKNKEIIEKIMQHLKDLPTKYRSVFLLRDVEGFSTDEVSKMLNMTVPAVKSNLRRARIALRDKLADYLSGE
ncbi:hypothetical protein AMJ80_09395 [bacterium SM23_31]|nr:MAG: hypothetical protein AMJ80_09395 [bacterium SM23_31]